LGQAGGWVTWKEWTYGDWNLALLQHVFRAKAKWQREPVERILAAPDELLIVVKDTSASATEVVEAFVAAARANTPRNGKTFGSFCYDYRGWTPASEAPPHFFGMLWLTCLAAHGHPDPKATFYQRMWDLLGKKDNLQRQVGDSSPVCFPPLWNDLQAWLAVRNGKGEHFRTLLLPTEVGRRTAIGQSWFLAFPHAEDRGKLARALWEEGLIGFEPPVHKVLRLLSDSRWTFSKAFKEDLGDFQKAFAGGSVTARGSAFWRAVRQEAMSPCVGQGGTPRRGADSAGARLAVADTQDGFQPLLCVVDDWKVPKEYTTCALPEPIGDAVSFLRGIDGELDLPVEDAFVYGSLLNLAHRKLVDQGLLLLREQSSAIFEVVSGSEAHGASVALVRNDLVDAFRRAFGGATADALLEGWTALTGCAVSIAEALPEGLERAHQLLPTMFPRVISPSGGIRIDGGFLRALHFLPHLHADGAAEVVVEDEGGRRLPCVGAEEDGRIEWHLPDKSIPRNGAVLVAASWPGSPAGAPEEAEVRLEFREDSNAVEYKPLPSGAYDTEACGEPECQVRGGVPVELAVTTHEASRSGDLFDLETQVRYLGPALGQMSRQRSDSFEWMGLGAFKRPEVLVFIGDPASPTMPSQASADSPRARRHWREAFNNAESVVVRTTAGAYEPVSLHPKVEQALAAFRRHIKVPTGAPTCPTEELSAEEEQLDGLVAPDAATDEAVAALAALSARRAGLGHKEVASVLGGLLPKRASGHEDFLAIQQLIRAWTECGQIDVLREVSGGHQVVVARRPRIVLVRRGPSIEGRIVGLLNPSVRSRVQGVAARRHVSLSALEAPNRWQPSVLRLRGSEAALAEVTSDLEFAPPEWLHWPPTNGVAPKHFNVSETYNNLKRGLATSAYKLHQAWDWSSLGFTRSALGEPGHEGVVVQRRLAADRTAIHVVLYKGEEFASFYTRNWALLVAYDLAGAHPFVRREGALVCRGISPVHLPLPISRLCALTGAGLPGPRFGNPSGAVTSYEYPFGTGLLSLLESVIPHNWIGQ